MGKAFLALLLVSSAGLAATPAGGGHGAGGAGAHSAGAPGGAAAGNSSGMAAGHATGTHIQSVRLGATADKPKPKHVRKTSAPVSPEVHNVVPTMVLTPCTTERRLRHECGEGPSHLR
jgi:hypothetical protein